MSQPFRHERQPGDPDRVEAGEHLLGDPVRDDPVQQVVRRHEQRGVQGAHRCHAFGVPRPGRDHAQIDVAADHESGDLLIPVVLVRAGRFPHRLDLQQAPGQIIHLTDELVDLVGGRGPRPVRRADAQRHRLCVATGLRARAAVDAAAEDHRPDGQRDSDELPHRQPIVILRPWRPSCCPAAMDCPGRPPVIRPWSTAARRLARPTARRRRPDRGRRACDTGCQDESAGQWCSNKNDPNDALSAR